MTSQKTKPSTKRTKKSPIVAVVVERRTPPQVQAEAVVLHPEVSDPASDASVQEPKEQRKQTVKTIATTLGETQPSVLFQIATIVKHLGSEAALRLLKDVQEIEANGGMLILTHFCGDS